jgi:uncharacterized repeat protein (TIGR03803 family)
VTATSQADITQVASAAVTVKSDTTPPSVVTTIPPSGETAVSQTTSISAQFNEELDPATVNSNTILLSNGTQILTARPNYDYSSNTVNLIPHGVLEAGTTYTVSIGSKVSDLAENQLGASYIWSFTTQAAVSVTASITPPQGLDPTTLTVLSFGRNESTPDSQGNSTAALRPYGTTIVAGMMPGVPFGFLALTIGGISGEISANVASAATRVLAARSLPGRAATVHVTRWQLTASPRAVAQPASVTLDFQTTAESLLFLTPPLMNPDPAKAQIIMAAIAADPNTAALAQALSVAWSETAPLKDPVVNTALQNAVVSVLNTLTGGANAQTLAQASITSMQAKGRRGRIVRTQASALDAGPSQISITPNCGSSSTSSGSGNLACLDLDYISLQAPNSPDGSGNYDVAVNNCTNSSILGCAVGWMAQVAPLASVPSGGVGSIAPGEGSNGPDSPTDSSGSPLMPSSCAPPASVSGCQSVFWVPAASNFTYLDPENDVEAGANALLNIATGQSGDQVGFGVVAQTQQNYIARFYSGGFADSVELSNVWAGSYSGGLTLWSSALTVNALSDVESVLSAVGVLPDSMLSCMTQQVVSTQLISQVSQFQQEFSNPNADYGSLFLAAVAQIGGDFIGAAGQCALDSVSSDFVDFITVIAEQSAEWVSVIPKILSAASTAGQVTQQIVELSKYATPVETAIASVGTSTSQVASIQISCPDSSMQIGQQQTCSASAFDSQNNSITSSTVSFQWGVLGIPGTLNLSNANASASAEQVVATSAGQASLVVTAPRVQGGPMVQATSTITINPATITTLTLVPTSMSGAIGQTWVLVARCADSNGNPVIPNAVTWTSGEASVASITNISGLPYQEQVQAVGSGTTTVTATIGTLTASAPVSVGAAGSTGIVVLVTPTLANVPAGGAQAFTGTVTGATSPGVNWSVNGISGGSSPVGTISSQGLYTAPTTIPNPATVTVTATSQAAPSFSASATVNIGAYSENPLYSFTGLADGGAPSAALVQGSDGSFYGTAQLGGTNGYGTVFKVDPGGGVTTLYEFSGADGEQPLGALIQASDGYFYGTTAYGGANGEGSIFKINSIGSFSTVYSFTGGSDGSMPLAGLIQAGNGILYGTTFGGGMSGYGSIFQTDTSGDLKTLYSFSGGTDGNGPEASLLLANDGYLYGTTLGGGDLSCEIWSISGCGVVFQVDAAGDLNPLYAFTGGTDGANPSEALIQASDGYLYGTTLFEGDASCSVSTLAGCGTVFKINSSGTFATLHDFSGGPEGGVPFSALVQGSDGDFYGTATAGGDPACSVTASENYSTYIGCGTVFKMDPVGNTNALYSFVGSPNDGSNPFTTLLQGSDGNFYGTTRWGGSASCIYTNNGGCGTFFRVAGPGGLATQGQTDLIRMLEIRAPNPNPAPSLKIHFVGHGEQGLQRPRHSSPLLTTGGGTDVLK